MKNISKIMLTASLMLIATFAAAHPDHGEIVSNQSSYLSGLIHPFTGLDHLVAMAAIGFWSMQQTDTMKNGAPFFVIVGMVVGAAIAWAGVSISGIEIGITMSVLLVGLLIASLVKLPTAVGGILVAAFMVAHGYAHGAEMAQGSNLVTYMLGFAVASLIITFGGRILGALMQKSDNRITRAVGGVVAVIGGVMTLG